MNEIEKQLKSMEKLLDKELDDGVIFKILKILGAGPIHKDFLKGMQLYSDFLPKAAEVPFTQRQRFLHFLWDILDKLPICVVANFAIPFRRMIAERLFKKCGKNFIADESVRFNFGQNIEVGDNVFINRWAYLDSKGGISIGDSVVITESVFIFTHSHSESYHSERSYGKVVIEDYAKIYTAALILPGVTVGKEAIVAAKSVVSKDVPAGKVVGGIPAKEIRERKNLGRHGAELNHVWFYNGAFQK